VNVAALAARRPRSSVSDTPRTGERIAASQHLSGADHDGPAAVRAVAIACERHCRSCLQQQRGKLLVRLVGGLPMIVPLRQPARGTDGAPYGHPPAVEESPRDPSDHLTLVTLAAASRV
jgi:hypothetical protein